MTDTKGNSHDVAAFADRLTTLAAAYKADVDAVIEDVKKADLDTPAVRRLAAWQRKDPVKRAEQEAIDHQYRFLAGEVDEPAALPEGELAEAARYYADKLTVRQVAEVMKISVGKAQKLKTLSGIFDVHQKMNVNRMNTPAVEMTADDLGSFDTGIPVSVREMVADDLGDPLLVTNPFRARVKAIAASVPRPKAPAASDTVIARAPDDDLEFPPGLDRRREREHA